MYYSQTYTNSTYLPRINHKLMEIWENTDENRTWDMRESLAYNRAFHESGWEMWGCKDKVRGHVPTYHDSLPMRITATCRMKVCFSLYILD